MKYHIWNRVAACVVLMVVGCSLSPETADAQAFMRVEETRTNANTYYYMLNPGSATIRVHVLGAVRLPGVYEISESTDLGQVIALSGGPVVNQQPRNTRTDISLRVYRPGPGGQQIIFNDAFESTLANPGIYPVMQEGDVIVMDVTQRTRFGWREAASIVSTIAVMALAAERVSRITR